jgi:N-carbamoyl-L-amino-acid hydrolase
LTFNAKTIDETDPVTVPQRLIQLLKETSDRLGYSSMNLPSGAGHDAQILASVTDAAMIFIPCQDGLSHCPQENIRWEDLEKGSNLLLHSLIRLAE